MNVLLAFLNVVMTCATGLQTVMNRLEQVERSTEQMRLDHEGSMEQIKRSTEQMRVHHEELMEQMRRSVDELRIENQRCMNIGPEMDQEIDTNVYE